MYNFILKMLGYLKLFFLFSIMDLIILIVDLIYVVLILGSVNILFILDNMFCVVRFGVLLFELCFVVVFLFVFAFCLE